MRQITAMFLGGTGDITMRLVFNKEMFGYLGISLILTAFFLLLLRINSLRSKRIRALRVKT